MKLKVLFCLSCIMVFLCSQVCYSEEIYVDCSTGDDSNKGTMESPIFSIQKAVDILRSKDNDIYVIKVNPGIYILDHAVSVSTEKEITNKRIVIEASILPGDPGWIPEKMPVITSRGKKGEISISDVWVVSFLINESNVTIRGFKFPGYFYPNTRYFPIARINKSKTDLLVEQCMFVGDEHASAIQVGVIAHGNKVNVDHCVFYNAKNAVVFWQDSGDKVKTGNRFTNSIIVGGYTCAIWTAWPDKDLIFENNIVTKCKHAWVKNYFNEVKYSMDNCFIVDNQYYQGVWHPGGVQPEEFEIMENNITKEGEVSLRMVDSVDKPLPIDYLHVIPDTPGYDMGVGIFKNKKQ